MEYLGNPMFWLAVVLVAVVVNWVWAKLGMSGKLA